MKNSTIYTGVGDLDNVLKCIVEVFADSSVEATDDAIIIVFKGEEKENNIKISFITENSDINYFTQQKAGMIGYISQINTEKELVKGKLLLRVNSLIMQIGIVTSEDIEPDLYGRLLQLTEMLNGFIFNPAGFFNHQGKLILGTNGDSEVEDIDVRIDAKQYDSQFQQPKSAEERKQKNINILKREGIPYIDTLPAIYGDDCVIRSVEEIVERAIALHTVGMKSEGINKDILDEFIGQFGVEDAFTSKEKEYLSNPNPSQQDTIKYNRQYECSFIMLWVLGVFGDEYIPFPNEVCDVSLNGKFFYLFPSKKKVMEKTVMLDREVILDLADFIYRSDWACVNARIHGEQPPGYLNPDVVYEWHKALNWITSYGNQDWDNVKTDT